VTTYKRTVLEPVVWISPDTDPAQKSSGRFAARLADRVRITLKELAVWQVDAGAHYDMQVEVDAVARAAAEARLSRYHLFGFSAGATVALAAALALGDSILSIAVLEPATIGDDDWGPIEATWRTDMAALPELTPSDRTEAFRRMLMRPGVAPPPARYPPLWDAQDNMLLEVMLERTGFVSGDLANLGQPTLIIVGGQSHPRFQHLAERMVEVMPNAETVVFPALNHFSPPHREEPDRFEGVLLDFWSRTARKGHLS
jgi:pimeloyl-ACP methyl ester carboxylesterase